MWTRDAGVFLREMAHWGYLDQGLQTLRCLFRHVSPNPQGFRMFPEYFKPGEPASGAELDGTSAILIGAVLLSERQPRGEPARQETWEALTGPGSPTQGLIAALGSARLVAGSGEFGGGCGMRGEFYNVVQNNLVCVMEPLKIARLILGLDNHNPAHLRLIPRLPLGWSRLEAHQAPVLTPAGLAYAEIAVTADPNGPIQQVTIHADRPLPRLDIRLGTARQPIWKSEFANAAPTTRSTDA